MAKIFTLVGMIEESLIEKVPVVFDDDNEHTTWISHRLNGVEVGRENVHVTLKHSLDLTLALEGL